MKASGHVLYKGDLYGILPGSQYTYMYMMDIDTYLHKIMANDNLREDLMKHGDCIASLLKLPGCDLIKQIEFDFDLIEVMLPCGTCFRILKRKFVHKKSLMMTSGTYHLKCMCHMTVTGIIN